MRLIALVLLTLTAACSDPQLDTNLSLGSNGLQITPSLSGMLGGAHVSISP